jgi:hypothetical protein
MKTQFVFAAVITVAALTGMITTNTLAAYAYDGGDESETNTEQELKQKNVGSGDSTNNNCGENLIKSEGGIECFDGEIGDGEEGDFTVCHVTGNPNVRITLDLPNLASFEAHLAHGDTVGACVTAG